MTDQQQPSTDIAQTGGDVAAAPGEGTALTIGAGQAGFTDQQVAALAQLGIQDASPGDVDLFFHTCKRTGLDPFTKQIYMIGRRTKVGGYRGEAERWETKWTIQVGIDGFRLLGQRLARAQDTGRPIPSRQFCGLDGQWRDVWLEEGPPVAAKGIITVGGDRYEAVVLFREYAQTKNGQNGPQLTGQWATKPATMLGKCAEAAAWRAAFPADFSGLYEAAEMDRSEVIDAEVVKTRTAPTRRGVAGLKQQIAQEPQQPAAPEQPAETDADRQAKADRTRLWNAMKVEGLTEPADALEWLSIQVHRELTSTADLTPAEVAQVAEFLETEQAKDAAKEADQ